MKIYVKPEYKEIVNTLEELAVSRSLRGVFDDLIELMAISIQTNFSLHENMCDKRKKRAAHILNGYTFGEMKQIFSLSYKLEKLYVDNPFRDVLGELYTQLRFNNKSAGQIFTPHHISSFMTKTIISKEEIEEQIKKDVPFVAYDLAAGSGINILTACEYLDKNNIDYQKCFTGVCQEIDRITALMCYISLTLNGCSAVIKIGDAAKDPYTSYSEEIEKGSDIWTTPAFNENTLKTMLGLTCN